VKEILSLFTSPLSPIPNADPAFAENRDRNEKAFFLSEERLSCPPFSFRLCV
jgi:hypothetical protein